MVEVTQGDRHYATDLPVVGSPDRTVTVITPVPASNGYQSRAMTLANRLAALTKPDRRLMVEAYNAIRFDGDIEQQRQRWLRFDRLLDLGTEGHIAAAMMLFTEDYDLTDALFHTGRQCERREELAGHLACLAVRAHDPH